MPSTPDIRSIQKAFYNETFQRYEIVAPNIYLDWQFNEMDLLGLRKSGYIDEIEIKLSKSDFLADFKKTVQVKSSYKCIVSERYAYDGYFKKTKHHAIKDGLPHCNYFSFLMPEDLAKKCEIPEYAGLYLYKIDKFGDGKVREVKTAPLLHKRKISDRFKYEIGRKMAYRYWNAT